MYRSNLEHSHYEGVKLNLIDEKSRKIHAIVLGPEGTSYEGGEWHFEFEIPLEYNLVPPIKQGTLKSLTKLYHPCVDNLEKGDPHFLECQKCVDHNWDASQNMGSFFR